MTASAIRWSTILLLLAAAFIFPALPSSAQSDTDLDALDRRVIELYRAGKFGEAIPVAEQYVAAAKNRYGEEHQRTATAINYLALLHVALGHYAEAEPLSKRVLTLTEKLLGPDHPDVGTSLNNLAELYRTQSRYAEAEPLYQRALTIAEGALGPDHSDVGRALNNLALLYDTQGRYTEAEPLYRRALAIAEKALGPDDPSVAISLNNLAELYREQALYAEAEPLYKRALGIVEKALGPDHLDVGRSLNNLALLYHAQGRTNEAEPLYKRSLAITEKALGPDHPFVGLLLSNLAQFYRVQGRYSEAEPLYKRALTITEKALGPDHPDFATYLDNLATLYGKQGRYAEAEPLNKRALAIRERALGPDHPDVGLSLNNLALLFHAQGRGAEAEPLYERALAITEKALGPDHANVGSHLSNLAGLYWGQQKWDLAYTHARRASEILIKRARPGSRTADGQTRRSSPSEPAENRYAFQWLVRAAWPLADERLERRAGLTAAAFAAAQWASRTAAEAALGQMTARFAKGQGPLADLVRDLQKLSDEAAQLDQGLIAATSSPPEKRSKQGEQALRDRLAEVETRLTALHERLKRDFPEYYVLASPEPLSIAEAQAELNTDEVFVQFLFAGDDIFAWAITKNASRWVRLADAAKTVPTQVRALRCGLDELGEWETEEQRRRCTRLLNAAPVMVLEPFSHARLPFSLEIAHQLHETLFGQLADLIEGKHLLIVPSGSLTSLPFHVLVTAKPKTAIPGTYAGYGAAAWLARTHRVTTLPSLASLKALRRIDKSTAANPYIAFGNPLLTGLAGTDRRAWNKQACHTLSRPPPKRGAGARGLIGTAGLFSRGGLADVEVLRQQSPLPETADELCDVARSVGAKPNDVYLGARATERTIKALSAEGKLSQARVVHFATHGLLASETEYFIKNRAEPALLLSPPAQASEEDDGLLTASEVAQLKLNADWVIMSACNTAGADKPDAEALSGLARAFFYAGARALLVSHWYVDSESAVALTTTAFADMTANPKLGRSAALQRSMLALIDRGGRFAHPVNWAPFVVVGEGAR